MPHTPLSNAEILKAIERQAHLSAIDGMFIKSPAQHGEVSRGHLELGSSSRLKKYEDGAAVAAHFMPHAGA